MTDVPNLRDVSIPEIGTQYATEPITSREAAVSLAEKVLKKVPQWDQKVLTAFLLDALLNVDGGLCRFKMVKRPKPETRLPGEEIILCVVTHRRVMTSDGWGLRPIQMLHSFTGIRPVGANKPQDIHKVDSRLKPRSNLCWAGTQKPIEFSLFFSGIPEGARFYCPYGDLLWVNFIPEQPGLELRPKGNEAMDSSIWVIYPSSELGYMVSVTQRNIPDDVWKDMNEGSH